MGDGDSVGSGADSGVGSGVDSYYEIPFGLDYEYNMPSYQYYFGVLNYGKPVDSLLDESLE